jgi:hypothetical protein
MWPKIRHTSARGALAAEPRSDRAGWREERLLRAGFDTDLAASIANDCAMDVHALIELVERGCPPTLAARILAPLEDQRKPC